MHFRGVKVTGKQGRQGIMDLDEDGFSARSRLLELLEDFDASRNNKRIVEFCASQSGFALDLLQIMIDQILEVPV